MCSALPLPLPAKWRHPTASRLAQIKKTGAKYGHFGPFWPFLALKWPEKVPHQVFRNYKVNEFKVHVLHQMSAQWRHPTASRLAKIIPIQEPNMTILAHFGSKIAKKNICSRFPGTTKWLLLTRHPAPNLIPITIWRFQDTNFFLQISPTPVKKQMSALV
jgi:hypothetical protein